MAVTPSSGARFFTSLYGTQHGSPAFQYLWDADVVWTDTNGSLRTGAQRPVTPGDFANITISGLTFSGDLQVSDSGVFTSTTSIITGSQLVVMPGYKSASVGIISGYVYVNGVGPIGAGIGLTYGNGYGGGYLSTIPLVVGTTGSTGAPSQVVVISEF